MSSDMSDDGEDEGEAEGWSPNLSPAGPSRPRGGGSSDPPPPSYDQVLEIVLENVLEFLTSRRDRNAASLVRRSWYRAEARTRRDLFVGNCYAVSPSRAAARFPLARALVLKGRPRFADFNLVPAGWGARFAPWAAAYPALERLSLKRVTVANDDLALIARSLAASFRDLSLICCDGFGTAGLAAVAAHCRYLRVLDLIDNDVEDEEVEVVDWISAFPGTAATCLESLVFECLSCAVNFKALEALVARSPSLRRLRVNHHISISQLRRLMERAPQLTHLGTGSFHTSAGHGGTDAEVGLRSAFLAGSRSLVCLSGFRDLEPEYLPAIYPACANLISLNISYAEITAEQLRPVILQCHNLQTFWVLDTLRDEGLQAVASTCKDLRELRVFPLDATEDSEGSVSDIGLIAISIGCRKLRSILYFCQQMTNSAVITMSNNCPELEVFRLCIMGRHRPDRFSGDPMDEGFGSIVKNCRKLTRLAVSGLLTDKAFRYIGQYGSSVRTLSVAFAGNSDRGLTYVLQGCTKLQKLEIRDSPFGDVGLLSGIHHYYNMRFLWMSSCNLTLGGCKAVAQALPHLVVEVIDGNGEAVEKLYMYRSLEEPRGDAPPFVNIL